MGKCKFANILEKGSCRAKISMFGSLDLFAKTAGSHVLTHVYPLYWLNG